MAPGESIIAPSTDSSASRFCGGTGAAWERWATCATDAECSTRGGEVLPLDETVFDMPVGPDLQGFQGMFTEDPDGALLTIRTLCAGTSAAFPQAVHSAVEARAAGLWKLWVTPCGCARGRTPRQP